MTSFGLREAAEQARISKRSIWRAIKSGRLSATRTDGGDYSIDAAELFRAFPPRSEADTTEQPSDRAMGQTAIGSEAGGGYEMALRVKLATAETEIAGLKLLIASERARDEALIAELRANRDELRQDRDDWRARAERLLAPPAPIIPAAPDSPRRPWWRRLVASRAP